MDMGLDEKKINKEQISMKPPLWRFFYEVDNG